MTMDKVSLPLIDISGYLASGSSESRDKVISDVANACAEYGFFQVKGHGIPLETQQGLLKSLENVFNMPKEEKLELSFLNNPCRRGYEAPGTTIRDGDTIGDSKECYYVGPEDPKVELSGFYGPNVWPNLPNDKFRDPVWEHYQATRKLGKSIWEILLEGLGHSPRLVEKFAQRPLAPMKMSRYLPGKDTLPGQFSAGAHTDFAGMTILLQEPDKQGLEVLHKEQWVPVPAMEDVLVIIIGDMTQKWSGGRYKSAGHRVVNKASEQTRLSCATFWQGDVFAVNPLDSNGLNKETIGQGLVRRFRRHYMLDHVVDEVEDDDDGPAMDELAVGRDGQLILGGCVVS